MQRERRAQVCRFPRKMAVTGVPNFDNFESVSGEPFP
jgi:hypothetical protein